ncbi:tetratricopeptide repeat protein [Rivibacter subsaxonicus]|uniref:Cytochrome c-type biogenesis protein CcmH n=1 Tax=Rivibacter subsaxonicus TaxID=457575 RepID=A0A4Q7VE33_9BURK|nr:tetratricopeptide repeat protein [Rivibacter subsaxonicus]RZT93793.1 cytochrome c-type biogenesis protein CcmH [Rivibacter subsaxonicus]
MTPTIESRRRKLQQLQALRDGGGIDAEAYARERSRLEAELVEAVMRGDGHAERSERVAKPASTGEQSTSSASRRLRLGLSLGVLALAVVGYALTGSPGGVFRQPTGGNAEAAATAGADGGSAASAEEMSVLVDRVAQRLKEQPEDSTGWALLARGYAALGRYAEAEPAFRKALALAGEDASLLADFADVLAAQNNGKLDGEAGRLIARALELEPDNVKALALSGSAAFDRRDYAGAVRQWERVERILPPASPFLGEVRASIAQARSLGGLPATPVTGPAPAKAEPGSTTAAAAKLGAVSGTVSLDAGLASKASPNDTVFVLARAASGPRMPLAVLRKQVKDLPLRFTLDDSMAMAAGAKLSDHAQVVLSARISKSGDALARPGDLAGQSAVVTPGASGVVIRISEVVGP